MQKTLAILTLLFATTACSLIYTTEKAAIVIINETPHVISYQALLSNQWTELFRVAPGEVDFLFEYEQKTKSEPPPEALSEISITLPDCKIMLRRQTLIENMRPPKNGRPGWNLVINPTLLTQAGCH